ncbi:MAG: acyl carrier protein [Blautia sp.]|nr:acyl carrier protein [Blautia sp.]
MLEKMKEMLAEILGVNPDSIREDTSFKDDLGANSLDLYEFVLALEDEYNIELPQEELSDMYTVGDFLDYLRDKGIEV